MSISKDEMRDYMRSRRAEWAKQRLCSQCGERSVDDRYVTCEACRQLARERQRRYNARKRENGTCEESQETN